ncbi:MAG: efflux transporter periplasmic adaptor subunit [Rhodobacteraceae bacterium]|nr:efflux transporter periplasmic adaptor subunit [Paracoccaceae bacterium]MBR28852.1 efflux transporter periplasmic adaptor subunit [Paracoccaceae bacterium]
MRLLPMLMALAVVVGLYFWIAPGDGDAARAAADDAAVPAAGDGAGAEAAPAPQTRPVRVVAFRSQAQDVRSAIIMRGRTEAHKLVDLRAQTSGLVISEPLRAGAEVEAGDTLCQLDPGTREAQLAEAEARLAQAEADASAAETLAQRGLTAENTAKARRAALSAAQAALHQVTLDIDRLTIEAPFDGVLETDAAELGALLSMGEVCARVISLDPIDIVGFVPEIDVDRVSEGQEAYARLISGREVAGTVSFVSRSADDTTRTFRVQISVDNPDGTIRDGLTADIAIPMPADRGHFAPQSALTLNDEGMLGVRAVEDGVARFHRVEILREEEGGLWLTGLPEETAIIYVGQEYASDGRPVTPTWEPWTGAPRAGAD